MPQAAAGLLMDKELDYLTKVTHNPERPCIAILGGAKVSDKIDVIQNLMKSVDQLLIGGAMAYTFLKAQGKPIGKSLVEDDKVDLARDLMARAGSRLHLPEDHVVASNEDMAGVQADADPWMICAACHDARDLLEGVAEAGPLPRRRFQQNPNLEPRAPAMHFIDGGDDASQSLGLTGRTVFFNEGCSLTTRPRITSSRPMPASAPTPKASRPTSPSASGSSI